jgi:hypothetical protein
MFRLRDVAENVPMLAADSGILAVLQWRLVCHFPTGCSDIAGSDVNLFLFCSLLTVRPV